MFPLVPTALFVLCILDARAGQQIRIHSTDRPDVQVHCLGDQLVISDPHGRILVDAGPVDTRWWAVRNRNPHPAGFGLQQLTYAEGDPSFRIPGQIAFPSPNPPETPRLCDLQPSGESRSVVLPVQRLLDDIRITFVPVELYAQVGDSVQWSDVYFENESEFQITQAELQEMILGDPQFDLPSPGDFELGHSLPSLWESNQDPVVSRILPDTLRCSWYGENPGWACAPDGQPWRRNIFDTQDLAGFLAGFQEQGLDLRQRDGRHPVIFLFSGFHWLNDFHAFPELGVGFCNLWAWRMQEGVPIVHDQVGPGYLMRLLLELNTPLLDTGHDPRLETSVGSGSWDLMAMGYAGFSSNGQSIELDQQVHWPALLNPVDRYRLGWSGNAVSQVLQGRYEAEPGQLVIRRNGADPDEILAVQNVPGSGEHPMRFHEFADPTGRQLVFGSHHGIASTGTQLFRCTGLMRPDTVRTDPLNPAILEDRYAAWPLWEQDNTPWASWSTQAAGDAASRLRLERADEQGRYACELDLALPEGTRIHFLKSRDMLEFRRGAGDSLHFDYVVLAPEEMRSEFRINASGSITWNNRYHFLPGPLLGGSMSMRYVVSPNQYGLSEAPALGLSGHFDAMGRDPGSSEYRFSDEVSILLSPHVTGEVRLAHGDDRIQGHGTWLAGAFPDGIRLWNTADTADSLLLQVDGALQHLFLDDLEGDGNPELIVITDRWLSVHRTSNAPEMCFEALPLNGTGPAMVVHDAALDERGCLLLVSGNRILLLDADGHSLLPTQYLSVPDELIPVTRACWAGGDAKGPRLALAGGPGTSNELQLLDLTGNVLFRFPESALPAGTVSWNQLLSADFLNNGSYSVAALAGISNAVGLREELCVITWSETNQAWGGSRIQSLATDPARMGPTSLVPLPGLDLAASARLAVVVPLLAGLEEAHAGLQVFDLSRTAPDLRSYTVPLPGDACARYIQVGYFNVGEKPDLLITSKGSRVDMLYGTESGFEAGSNGSLIHYTPCTTAPVLLRSGDHNVLGLAEDGLMSMYNLYSHGDLLWTSALGPGQSGQLRYTSRISLTAPRIRIDRMANIPILTIDPTTPCTHAVIYRADNEGLATIQAIIPWDGQNPLTWEDAPTSELPYRGMYQVRAAWLPTGPDGALYHP